VVAYQRINLQLYRLRIVRDRKEDFSLSDKAYPLELVLLPGSARISQPLWRIILGSMRSEGSDVSSATQQRTRQFKPGDWYNKQLSYDGARDEYDK
jgi:hypothetical protein